MTKLLRKLTDAQCRRQAANLAAQLPADKNDRKRIMDYMQQLGPFLDGEDIEFKSTGNSEPLTAARIV